MREADARARMADQASREERLAKADLVIDNSGTRAGARARRSTRPGRSSLARGVSTLVPDAPYGRRRSADDAGTLGAVLGACGRGRRSGTCSATRASVPAGRTPSSWPSARVRPVAAWCRSAPLGVLALAGSSCRSGTRRRCSGTTGCWSGFVDLALLGALAVVRLRRLVGAEPSDVVRPLRAGRPAVPDRRLLRVRGVLQAQLELLRSDGQLRRPTTSASPPTSSGSPSAAARRRALGASEPSCSRRCVDRASHPGAPGDPPDAAPRRGGRPRCSTTSWRSIGPTRSSTSPSMLFALFVLFLPPTAGAWVSERVGSVAGAPGAHRRRACPRRVHLVLVAVPVSAGLLVAADGGRASTRPSRSAWSAVASSTAPSACSRRLRFLRQRPAARGRTACLRPHHAVFLLVPLLVVVNGFTPYLELKTGYGWNMYSNLRTVDGESNHLLVRRDVPVDRRPGRPGARSSARTTPPSPRYAARGYALTWQQFRDLPGRPPRRPRSCTTAARARVSLAPASAHPELVEPIPAVAGEAASCSGPSTCRRRSGACPAFGPAR